MRFFLDENMSVISLEPLRFIFRRSHEFMHAVPMGLSEVDDVDLYPQIRAAGASVIISKDGRQLVNQVERRGLYDNRLSFVHLRMKGVRGEKGLALELAALTATLPYIVERWDPEPSAFRVRGLQSGFTERVSSHVPLWMPDWGSRPRL